MDASISDSESDEHEVTPILSAWQVNYSSEWTVYLNQLIFRHPRVLLAYFRFVSFTNELAETSQEYIRLPSMPRDVKEYILNHISFKETPSEFAEEINEIHSWVNLLSQ